MGYGSFDCLGGWAGWLPVVAEGCACPVGSEAPGRVGGGVECLGCGEVADGLGSLGCGEFAEGG